MNRMTRKFLVGAAVAAGLVFTGPHPKARAADALLGEARNVTVNFVNADMVDVLRALATQTGANIVAGPECKDKQISISMKGVNLTDALDMVTHLNGLAYQNVTGTWVVATPGHLKEMYPGESVTSVYTLTSMKPVDAVATLGKMIPALLAQAQGSVMVTLTGTPEEVEQGRKLLARMEGADAVTNGERQTIIYELQHLNPSDATRALVSLIPEVMVTIGPARNLPGSGKVGSTANATSELNIETTMKTTSTEVTTPGQVAAKSDVILNPGEESTTLLLTGYTAALARATSLLKTMDRAPRQVEITARVVDLRDDDGLKLGVKYSAADMGISEKEFDSKSPSAGFATSSIGRVLSFGQFARLPLKIAMSEDLESVVTNSKILANPRIAAVDGRPARIFIGDTITFVLSATANSTTNVASYTTEKLHVGITLLATPRISPDGDITLEVHPTVSALSALRAEGGVNLPTISERSVDTTIRMKDGETIAIGGLLRDDDVKTMTSVPFLSKLPFFGELFKHRNKSKIHSDVTIFITTKIMPESV